VHNTSWICQHTEKITTYKPQCPMEKEKKMVTMLNKLFTKFVDQLCCCFTLQPVLGDSLDYEVKGKKVKLRVFI